MGGELEIENVGPYLWQEVVNTWGWTNACFLIPISRGKNRNQEISGLDLVCLIIA
jgi:hypothetical protein